MCPAPRSPCIRTDSSTRIPPSAGLRARYTKGRATFRSSARTATSTPRCSPRSRRFPSRRRCSSCRITTSSGCCTRSGVPLESLGVPTRDETAVERDPRKIWQRVRRRTTTSFAGRPRRVARLRAARGVRRSRAARRASRRPHLRSDRRAPGVARVPAARAVRAASTSRCWRRPTRRPTRSSITRRFASPAGAARVIPTFRPDALFRIALAGMARRARGARARERALDRRRLRFARGARRAARRCFARSGATATDHAVRGAATPSGSRRTRSRRCSRSALRRRGDARGPARASRRTC